MKFNFCLLLCSALLFVPSAVVAEIPPAAKPQIGDISDNRSTGQFFKGLEVEIKLPAEQVANVGAVRVAVDKAFDESGQNLINPEEVTNDFQALNTFGGGPGSFKVKLSNPARKSATIKQLSGSVKLFQPAADPNAEISVPLTQTSKPLTAPALKEGNIALSIMTKDQYAAEQKKAVEEQKKKALADGMTAEMVEAMSSFIGGGMGGEEDAKNLYVSLTDPEARVIKFRLFDKAGREIDSNGSMTSSSMKTIYFSEPVPADGTVKVQVATAKSLITVPFQFESVPLP